MKTLLNFICFFIVLNTWSQVGIGTTNPEATLDIRSTNQATPANTDGILIPKTDVFPAINPTVNQDGMLLFITGDSTQEKGFYYWDNAITDWVSIRGAKKIDDLQDGKSDSDGSEDGSSIFLGIGAGDGDDSTNNKNTGVGFESLNNNSIGEANVAMGYQSLFENSDGSYNVGMGFQSLFRNRGGSYNVANGAYAMYYNEDASFNVANGAYAMYNNRDGQENVANGAYALYNNWSGSYNVANGAYSLYENLYGEYNVANGYRALYNNQEGYNVGIGAYSLYTNTLGENNVAVGYTAMQNNVNGSNNVAVGAMALSGSGFGLSTGDNNVAIGSLALLGNTSGSNNLAIGYLSLYRNTTGSNNVGIGYWTLHNNRTGNNNVAIGEHAGLLNENGSGNVFLGYEAGYYEMGSDKLYIGNGRFNTLIYGDFNANYLGIGGNVNISNNLTTGGVVNINAGVPTGIALRVNGSEALWYDGTYFSWGYGGTANFFADNIGVGITNPNVAMDVNGSIEYTGTITDVSDSRLKENLKPIVKALERIKNIEGYSYNMINDVDKNREYGVLAQDVQKVFSELVTVIDDKEHLGVSYIQFIPILLEAIKEQQNIIESQTEVRKLQQDEVNMLSTKYYDLLNRIQKMETNSSN